MVHILIITMGIKYGGVQQFLQGEIESAVIYPEHSRRLSNVILSNNITSVMIIYFP